MRAVIINPWDRTVKSVEQPFFTLHKMYAALSGPEGYRPCEDINSVRIGRDQYLWVDGEGLLIPEVPIWYLIGYPRPLAGMGLILGIDETGDNKSTHLEPEWVQSMVSWSKSVTTGELGPMEEGPGYIKLGDPILKEKN